jgi:nucleoside-diphosphate-sugar epimerase
MRLAAGRRVAYPAIWELEAVEELNIVTNRLDNTRALVDSDRVGDALVYVLKLAAGKAECGNALLIKEGEEDFYLEFRGEIQQAHGPRDRGNFSVVRHDGGDWESGRLVMRGQK